MAKVAFLGLGVMGYPMAGFLRTKGQHEVTVYNRTSETAERWREEYGGAVAWSPAEAAENAEFVFCCVGNDDHLQAVTIGDEGAFSTMESGAVFVDHTSASADVVRKLSGMARERGLGFLDAPVSGGEAGARNGVLTVMVGGDHRDFDRAEPLIDCFAKKVGLMGDAGAGQLTKLMNQICIAGLVQSLSEAIHFAKSAGLDIDAAINLISEGAAGSWQMENRYETMARAKYEHGFAVDWMRKDLANCLAEGKRLSVSLPITALVDQFYADIQNLGGGRWDTSALLARLEAMSKQRL
ncbi:MAG: NAD(P)-dependent oxidoreductase [Kiloniellales bacterium]